RPPPTPTPFPYTTLFRSADVGLRADVAGQGAGSTTAAVDATASTGIIVAAWHRSAGALRRSGSFQPGRCPYRVLRNAIRAFLSADRKSTRLNSSHGSISY